MQNLGGNSGQIKAAIYCRVSTQDQDCDRQRADLVAYANRCGYSVIGNFIETASGSKIDRVERKKVIELARARSIDIVLVSELTRWGRSTIDLIDSLNLLQSWGVSLIAQNGFQFDLSTPHGKMIASIMATLAEFERDLLKERIRSGISNARDKGKKFGRPTGGKTADNCGKIRELKATGQSLRSIAKTVGLSKTSVAKCIERNSELPEGMDF